MATQQNDYITVAEYATRRGVSVSAVYKRLGGTLAKYVKIIDGKRYLSVEALVEEGITPPVEKVEEGLKNAEQTPPAIQVALEALEKQLAEKDKQIARLQEEAAELRQEAQEKDKFIREQSSRLSLLWEQSQELQRNNQILLRLSQGGKIETPEAQEAPAEAQDAAQGEEQPASQEEAPAEETAGTERRRGFFGRLFGGKKK
jgi:paraquat-inducible protein B